MMAMPGRLRTLDLIGTSIVGITAAIVVCAARSDQVREGSLSGRIVEAKSGEPVARARVTLQHQLRPWDQSAVVADDRGQFHFRGLRPGSYLLSASKSGYTPGGYGQRFPHLASQSLELTEGEEVADLRIRLWKHAVISGTVRDAVGDPVVRAVVRALRRIMVAGTERLTFSGAIARTDDRGAYRLAGLTPGTYVVAVPSSADQPGAGRDQADYPTTFHPSAWSAEDAVPIIVASGEERVGADLTIAWAGLRSVAGEVAGWGRVSEPLRLSLFPVHGTLASDLATVTTLVTPGERRFRFPKVPPGHYVLRAMTLPGPSARQAWFARPVGDGIVFVASASALTASAPVPSTEADSVWCAEIQVVVESRSDTEVQLTLQAAARINGRLVFNGTSAQPSAEELQRYRIPIFRADGADFPIPLKGANADGTFVIDGLPPGQYVVSLSQATWVLESLSVDGRPVGDNAIEVGTSDLGVVLTLTDRPSEIAGLLTDDEGRLRPEASVFVFPTDRRLWVGQGPRPMRLREVRPNRRGEYRVPGLPSGDYFVGTAASGMPEEWRRPEFLTVLSQSATRLRVSDGEQRTLNLRIRARDR
jgi:hypothetical protein